MELHENDKKLCDVKAYKGDKIPIGQQFGQSAPLETVRGFKLISPVKPKEGLGTSFYIVDGDKKLRIYIHDISREGDEYVISVSLK